MEVDDLICEEAKPIGETKTACWLGSYCKECHLGDGLVKRIHKKWLMDIVGKDNLTKTLKAARAEYTVGKDEHSK